MSAPATSRITVNATRCASTGVCESVAPDLFEIGDDGALVVLDAAPDGARLEQARQAARSCPTRALTVA